ncbi:MAG: phosphate ABC transporter substrate-binding protein PstS [Candidatus Binataceae bacterium]
MRSAPGISLTLIISLCLRVLIPTSPFHASAGPGVVLADEAADGSISLLGTGASFPAPLYELWFRQYNQLHPEVQVNYQALGSGAGIKQFQQGLVNFAASDAAMTDQEIAAVKDGVVMLPMTAGIVVLAYNLPGVPVDLKLSRAAYTGIFLGKITRWNDNAIARANPGVKLPDLKVVVITKSDASGTTFVFTNHLSAISAEWKNAVGTGKTVNFPVGVAARGTLGVTALIKRTPGAIGYVEYGYAKQSGVAMAMLENRAGNFVKPELATGRTALASVSLPPNLRAWMPDPPGADSYPIVTYTWLLCYKKYKDPKIAAALKSLLRYCLTGGQAYSAELGYIPLPPEVVKLVTQALDRIS